MKKTILPILSLATLLALVGCSKSSYQPSEQVDECPFAVESIELNSRSTALLVGEQYQLKPLITPLIAYNAELVFKSSKTSVATVNKKGLITAKGQGEAIVTVCSKKDPTVSMEIKVYVAKKRDKADVRKMIEKMGEYQEAHVTAPRKLRTWETETRTWYIDGEMYSQDVGYEEKTISKDDAFFYVGGRDVERRTFNASPIRSTFGYYIFTDVDYHSYIYHHNDYSKNRCYVPTEFYLGTETTRGDVVYSILNSLFNSGSDIAENNIEDAMGTDWFEYSSLCKAGGYGDDFVYGKYTQSLRNQTSSPLMEQNLDIPCYVKYNESDAFNVYYYKGNVKSYFVNFNISYQYKGKDYALDIKREYTFERDDEFELVFPDKTEYKEVADIFEL